ncbi:hypothetical protein [Bradyrhizobium sp. USDA 4486]
MKWLSIFVVSALVRFSRGKSWQAVSSRDEFNTARTAGMVRFRWAQEKNREITAWQMI